MMNARYDNDVPALWTLLQENYSDCPEPSYPHLEVALGPRIVAVPAT